MQAALTPTRSAPLDVEHGPTHAAEAIAPSAPSGPRLKPEAQQFEEIYRASFGHVCRWVRALGGPGAERDDLVQDVFLIVHRRLPDFDGKNLHGWLYQITRHRVRDFRRLRWFRIFLHSSRVDDSLAGSFAGARNPERTLEEKERAALLERLLSKLPEAQRAAFVLFEVDGYSGEEIARFQGVPLNTVWGRIHKARTKLSADIARLQSKSSGGRSPL